MGWWMIVQVAIIRGNLFSSPGTRNIDDITGAHAYYSFTICSASPRERLPQDTSEAFVGKPGRAGGGGGGSTPEEKLQVPPGSCNETIQTIQNAYGIFFSMDLGYFELDGR